MLKIGYMGIPFSNSEQAAKDLISLNGWDGAVLVPLMCSANVVSALGSGEVDYGVVAVRNVMAGPVVETENALYGKDDIKVSMTVDVPIHHCLFVKEAGVPIRKICSHVQALLQTENNLERMYPGAERMEVEDTAYAAELLSEGALPSDVAVVCRKEAGDHYGLTLVGENIEDDEHNMTTFALLKLIS